MKIITNPMEVNRQLALIKAEAQELSAYTDQDYAGYSDDEYGAAAVDAVVKHQRRQMLDYKFRVTNTGSAPLDRLVALCAPFGTTEAKLGLLGHTVDGVLRDGQVVPGAAVGTNDVVGTGLRANRPIELLMSYAQENPLRVIGLTISSNNTASFETDLQIVQLNPFKQEEERTIDLANYFSPNNLTGKKIECDLVNDGLDFSMDNQTLIKWKVLAGTSAIITLRFGGVDNQAAKFDKRAMTTQVSATTKLNAMGSIAKVPALRIG